MYRDIPGGTGVRCLRHCLVVGLAIDAKYMEREGEALEAEELGEGSYSRVLGSGPLAMKLISDRERPWVHRSAVENALDADRRGLGPRVFGHGTVQQKMGGHFVGTALLMERLSPLGPLSEADTAVLLRSVEQLSRHGFHNDLKLPNVLRRGSQPVIIDWDLMSPWHIKVAVTSSCLEHDFQPFLEPLGELAWRFREYYDLFALSLTLQDGPVFRAVFARLLALWALLEHRVLKPLMGELGATAIQEVPFEVLVRVPLHAVTVSLFDLRGNLYAHLDRGGSRVSAADMDEHCGHAPQLACSIGVKFTGPLAQRLTRTRVRMRTDCAFNVARV